VYYRESKNGLYSTLPFVLANTLVNIPFLFLCTVFFTLICYWAIVRLLRRIFLPINNQTFDIQGLNPGAGAFFRFLGFLFLALFTAESQVLVIAALLPIFVAALAICAL
jgi:ABC-type multidrug transport system permease subunit